jgi:RHS repeat-associated protein
VQPPGDSDNAYWKLTGTDQAFRLKTERFGNGVSSARDYYALSGGTPECAGSADASCMPGLLRDIVTRIGDPATGTIIQSPTYSYDGNGNLSWLQPSMTAAGVNLYAYDGFDRLSTRTWAPGSNDRSVLEEYHYDVGGNLTFKNDMGAYTYTSAGRVAAAGDNTYSYDFNGNQTDRSGSLIPGGYQHLDYNDFDMPWRITTGRDASALPTELEYTADGARVIKRKLDQGGFVSQVTLDIGELYQQISEYSPAGSSTPSQKTHQYRIYAAGRQVAQINRVEHSGTFDPEQIFYIHDDQLGSTSVITNAAGDVENREFTSFGEADTSRTTWEWNQTKILSGFTGHQHDDELGLVNMRGRLYDPRLGRFITADPYVTEPLSPQGLNRYSYVQNNPVNFTDPSGFEPYSPDYQFSTYFPGYYAYAVSQAMAQAQAEAQGQAMAQAQAGATAQAMAQAQAQGMADAQAQGNAVGMAQAQAAAPAQGGSQWGMMNYATGQNPNFMPMGPSPNWVASNSGTTQPNGGNWSLLNGPGTATDTSGWSAQDDRPYQTWRCDDATGCHIGPRLPIFDVPTPLPRSMDSRASASTGGWPGSSSRAQPRARKSHGSYRFEWCSRPVIGTAGQRRRKGMGWRS